MNALSLIKQNSRGYVLLNQLHYGLVAISMVYSFAFPEVQIGLMEELRREFPEAYPAVVEAYTKGDFPTAQS